MYFLKEGVEEDMEEAIKVGMEEDKKQEGMEFSKI
jgi:hypothetical protein